MQTPLMAPCLRKIEHVINSCNALVGKAVSWLVLLMACTVTVIVVLRSFGLGAVMAQESVVFMHAALLMLASAYTLLADEHVRVDIFYRNYTPAGKAWLNLLGAILFLLPLSVFTVAISWDFVVNSWAQSERSQNAGGMGGIYLIKSLMLISGGLLALQAIATLCKELIIISFQPTDSHD